ncbi:MAG: iron-siderophore ABC transporter substrate-binding protein [Thermoleophilaceae bacterium]|nr:iron-siderophore ABC transporter substrate-binding protein [Thermoleophilaceae bacterium]
MRPRLTLALGAALALVAAFSAAPAGAGPAKRVVAIEWNYAEDLLAVGVRPVGIADIKGMEDWTPVQVPAGVKDVGTRTEPSLERIAALEPDLIIAPKGRIVRSLDQLREIARVKIMNPFPQKQGRDTQYRVMLDELRQVAKAVGRRARADAVIRSLDRSYAPLRKRLKKAGLARAKVTVGMAGGTLAAPGLRLFTDNSVTAAVLRRLGLRNAWTAKPRHYGYTEGGIEQLRKVERNWFVFAYPRQFSDIIRGIQEQDAWTELALARNGRARTVPGNTWPFGGPLATRVLAQRITGALVR